jgi:IS5 family transposase
MRAKSRDNRQASFLYPDLLDQLNPAHPLLKLAKHIPWQRFEDEFSRLYSQAGRPAITGSKKFFNQCCPAKGR